MKPNKILNGMMSVLGTLRVEPAALFMMTATVLTFHRFQDIMIRRVCQVDLGIDEGVCEAIVTL
jgi:hypothetical protein